MDFNLFIARRLFRKRDDVGKVSRPAILIATSGVAVGLTVMIVAVCVVLGFKQEISSKVIGFGSHIQIQNYYSLTGEASHPIAIPDSFMVEMAHVNGVSHVQRFCNKEGVLKTDNDFKGIVLHGVGPEFDTAFLAGHLEEGVLPVFSDSVASNQIVISRRLADELQLRVGSKIYAYFFENTVRVRRFTVVGIYCTHLTEFDQALVFTDIYTCNKLNGWEHDQFSGLEIAVNRLDELDKVTRSLVERVNRQTDVYGGSYVAMSIRELYPQIFAWLNLLDVNVWVILALMVSVAGFTMISGLLIIILERTNFIGIMKALGATDRSIRRIFLTFAVFVIGKGVLWGNLLGVGLVLLQSYTGLFRLDASIYYVETVPVLFHGGYILLINVMTVVICLCALIVPSFLISRIYPAKSIRFE